MRIHVVVPLVSCIAFVGAWLYFVPAESTQGSITLPVVSADVPDTPVSRPVRLKIPAIRVDAAIEAVGLAADGTMDVPTVTSDVAWFELGPTPGAIGSAVITGHYGWKNGIGMVFNNLHKLRPGDIVTVEDSLGVTSSFVVQTSRRYDPNADVPEVFESADGKAHLNLITCEGIWDAQSNSYSKRLVVFTDQQTEITDL